MRAPIFQLDSFTTKRFAGNPAAVVVLEEFLPDASMQAIAAENNLAETAFLVAAGTEHHLRWFTPTVEVKLCGHATLATAAIVMERLEPNREEVVFQSLSGPLTVRRSGSRYVMDFPARRSDPVAAPAGLAEALGAVPVEVHLNSFNYLAVFEDPQVVRTLRPDMNAIAHIEREGVIVTAPGDPPYDFTSRYFAPAKGIPEDPLLGKPARQDGLSRLPSLQPRRRGDLRITWRARQVGRLMRLLPRRRNRDLTLPGFRRWPKRRPPGVSTTLRGASTVPPFSRC